MDRQITVGCVVDFETIGLGYNQNARWPEPAMVVVWPDGHREEILLTEVTSRDMSVFYHGEHNAAHATPGDQDRPDLA